MGRSSLPRHPTGASLAAGPDTVGPAIGGGGLLPRPTLTWRILVAVALLLVLGVAKHVISARAQGPDTLTALPGGRQVTVGLIIGGTPFDSELQTLASAYHVDGVVNLTGASVAEQVTAAAVGQGYLNLPSEPGMVLSWPQLARVAAFLRVHDSGGDAVYLHDDSGGGLAVATADMLLLLRGDSPEAASGWMTLAERKSLTGAQSQAIAELSAALAGTAAATSTEPRNPYAAASVTPW